MPRLALVVPTEPTFTPRKQQPLSRRTPPESSHSNSHDGDVVPLWGALREDRQRL